MFKNLVPITDLDRRLIVLIEDGNRLGLPKHKRKQAVDSALGFQIYSPKYNEQLDALKMEAMLLKSQDHQGALEFDQSFEHSISAQELSEQDFADEQINVIQSQSIITSHQPLAQAPTTINQKVVSTQQATNTNYTDPHYQVFQKPKTATTQLEALSRPSRLPTKVAPVASESVEEDEELLDISIDSHSSSFNELSEEEISRLREAGFDEMKAFEAQLNAFQSASDQNQPHTYQWQNEITQLLIGLLPPPYRGYEKIAPVYGVGNRLAKTSKKLPWQFQDDVNWQMFDVQQLQAISEDYSLSNPPADLQLRNVAMPKRTVTLKLNPANQPTLINQKITAEISLDELNQAYQNFEQQLPVSTQVQQPVSSQAQSEYQVVRPAPVGQPTEQDDDLEHDLSNFDFDPNAFDEAGLDEWEASISQIQPTPRPKITNIPQAVQPQAVQPQAVQFPLSFQATEIILTGENTEISQPPHIENPEEQFMPLRSFDDEIDDLPSWSSQDLQKPQEEIEPMNTAEFQAIRSSINLDTTEIKALNPVDMAEAIQNTTLPEKKKKGFLSRLFGGKD